MPSSRSGPCDLAAGHRYTLTSELRLAVPTSPGGPSCDRLSGGGSVAAIVVGFDGSPHAARALAWACGTATAKHLPLRVVTAVEARLLPAASIVRPPTEEDIEAALQAAQEEVDRLLSGRHEAPVDCTVVAVIGQPAAVLLDEAEGADQLVVGSRGLGGFSRLLIGSQQSGRPPRAPPGDRGAIAALWRLNCRARAHGNAGWASIALVSSRIVAPAAARAASCSRP